VIDPKITEHHGRLVKTTGDGLLVEFGSVVDALHCATEAQQEMRLRNSGVAWHWRRFQQTFLLAEGNRAGKAVPKFRPGVSTAFRTAESPQPGTPKLNTR
jgi:adenylate cyclase